ncbi:YbaB/EbfC family nucleoid-associated protein [Nonomuraea sp. NPDC049309]|uniref:YbaB/EbfC family nucleoid-associated protein n=1 Tax=Nonomuraea sp. NPDC049309 TaxID=3364350 RepID=UPI00371A8C89
MIEPDFGGIDIDQLIKDSESRMARVVALQERLSTLVGRAQDEDGLVTVEMGQAGLQDLILHPKAMRLTSGELAERIKRAFADASADLQRQLSEAMEEEFGENNPMRFATDPDGQMELVRRAQAAADRMFEDAMGQLDRIRNRMEG